MVTFVVGDGESPEVLIKEMLHSRMYMLHVQGIEQLDLSTSLFDIPSLMFLHTDLKLVHLRLGRLSD